MDAFQIYTKKFYWNDALGCNTDYNFEIVNILVNAACNVSHETRVYYYKPIYILIAGIIECTLYDFLIRIQQHTEEKIKELNDSDISKIKNLDLPNKLRNYVELCRKYCLLGENKLIYERITSMAEIRNRVHIQNARDATILYENELWTTKMVQESGALMKEIFIFFFNNYPRPKNPNRIPWELPDQAPEFPSPWDRL